MDIGLIGGTGDIGEGLGIRWAKNNDHNIYVGSREEERAKRAAEKYRNKLSDELSNSQIEGYENSEAIKKSEVVLLSLPYNVIEETLDELSSFFEEQVVISPIVPLYKEEGVFECKTTCAAVLVDSLLPSSVKVVSAFHSVPAKKLADPAKELNCDVVVCGDNEEGKEIVFDLINDIEGLKGFQGGPLEVSSLCESLTPLLLNISIRNKIKNPSIKFVDGA